MENNPLHKLYKRVFAFIVYGQHKRLYTYVTHSPQRWQSCINITSENKTMGGCVEMKKKMLQCKTHGLTLHRCKRRYWHTAKDKVISDYTEHCFKCIEEGRYSKAPEIKKQAHISVR